MRTGFSRGGRLVQRSHIIDTVTNDVDVRYDWPGLHPLSVEGETFEGWADNDNGGALHLSMQSRFPDEQSWSLSPYTTLDQSVLYNGHQTLKISKDAGPVCGKVLPVGEGFQRLFIRSAFRLEVVDLPFFYLAEVGTDLADELVRVQPAYGAASAEKWKFQLESGNQVSMSLASLNGRWVETVTLAEASPAGGGWRARFWVDGALVLDDLRTSSANQNSEVTEWRLLELDFAFTTFVDPASPDNFAYVGRIDFTPWYEGFPCPFSGLEGLS